ncbi:MAG: type II toxin-antitoxin system HicB family antitoxin [Calothrix sp. SM1_7_51]|nr:type II toxin-antitoxin system HicB family antitoxin [Calothrix sp. SM1_7_51]
MNLSFLMSPPKKPSKLTYDVLVENEPDGSVSATTLDLTGFKAYGATEEEALTKLYEHLTARLANAKIVSLSIELEEVENPWLKLAGKYKDDPQFEAMLEYIEADRRQLDAEMEAYNQQSDVGKE